MLGIMDITTSPRQLSNDPHSLPKSCKPQIMACTCSATSCREAMRDVMKWNEILYRSLCICWCDIPGTPIENTEHSADTRESWKSVVLLMPLNSRDLSCSLSSVGWDQQLRLL